MNKRDHHMPLRHRRSNIDMLHGSLADKILLFALPLAATSVLQQLFNAADMAVVGRFVGEEAMAAVGSNSYLINLMVTLFVGISMGTNVVLSHSIGADIEEDIRRTVHTSIIVAVIGGVFIAALGECFAVRILGMLSVPADVIGMAETYLRVYLLGLPAIFLYNFEAAIFRSIGDTETPLVLMILSGILNVGLNLFFVVIIHMTVEGVAIATAVSNLFSAVVLFMLLTRREDAVRIRNPELRVDPRILSQILRIGIPSGIQGMMFSISNITLQSAVNSLGTTVIAATSAAAILEIVAYFVLAAFGQACTTFVGQNYGARQLERCGRSFRYSMLLDYLFTAVTCGLILLFVRPLLGLFNGNPEIIRVGTIRLQVVFFAYLFSVPMEVCSGFLRGFGESLLPTVTSLVCICGLRVLWILFLFPHFRTYTSIVMVYPVSIAADALVMGICCIYVWKRVSR